MHHANGSFIHAHNGSVNICSRQRAHSSPFLPSLPLRPTGRTHLHLILLHLCLLTFISSDGTGSLVCAALGTGLIIQHRPCYCPAPAPGTAPRQPGCIHCCSAEGVVHICVCRGGIHQQKQLGATPKTEHEVRCSDSEKGEILVVVRLVLLGGDQDLLQPRL